METLCSMCGNPVNPKSKNTMQRVQGWEKKRSQGGANQIILREVLPEFAHVDCVDARKLGILPGQEPLFMKEDHAT